MSTIKKSRQSSRHPEKPVIAIEKKVCFAKGIEIFQLSEIRNSYKKANPKAGFVKQ
jgi:hypothetical protein